MTYRVEILPRASRELLDAARWIERNFRSSAAAHRWVRGLRARIATLQTLPHRCPLADEGDAFGEEVRELLYGKRRGVYRILFAIRGDVVSVLTIRHASRGDL